MSEKYDTIGKGYNQTRKADPYLLTRMYHHLQPIDKGYYVDIGCGTGNYTIGLHRKGLNFTGIDPSHHMLSKAKERCATIEWVQGTAEAISLPDRFSNGVLASLTTHHWADLKKGFQEVYRILKPGGRLVIFTSTPKQMRGYWLRHYFPKMLADSIEQMPAWDLVFDLLLKAGFSQIDTEKYFIQDDLQDQFLYIGKHHPELYLDQGVRQGISSFSALANQQEVEKGLAQLERDIASGDVQKIIEQYENEDGDYLFVIAHRND